MVVRVKVRLRALKGSKGKTVDSIALINAGFESEKPEVVIPVGLAERLGLWPKLPEGTRIETYEVAGGGKVRTHRVEDCLETQIVTEDVASPSVKTVAAIMEGEREVVLSDKSISAHQMILEEVGQGIWRFRGESKSRRSENPEYW